MPRTLRASLSRNYGRAPHLSADAEPDRLGGRLAAAADLELAQDRRDVVVDGLLGDEQLRRDVRVAVAADQQLEHLQPAGGELGRVLAGRGTRAEPYATSAALAQTSRDDRRRSARAEFLQLPQALA